MKPILIGLIGGSASGKTSFLRDLAKEFNSNELCIISQDNYYIHRDFITKDQNGIHNFDLPSSFNLELYISHLKELKQGNTVHKDEYTFYNSAPKTLAFVPTPLIIIEGIFTFLPKEAFDLFDYKIFIDVQHNLMLNRRIKRDFEERGFDLEDVTYRWENHVFPAYEQYILPFRDMVDIIIPNNEHYANGLKILTSFFKTLL
ncbi:uridine kinase family protein [Arsenicibacter rosenii]|uniref:Uridine kinase n=1 Tax=Arsenicibacter rosenii TaxID=1750698 RepID=A0A1S2VR17_9BACT|nr:uridine kinase [Arsenicibacter rosenii]OIN61211.1 uridine kinase [Arsenicibacter rosenii]